MARTKMDQSLLYDFGLSIHGSKRDPVRTTKGFPGLAWACRCSWARGAWQGVLQEPIDRYSPGIAPRLARGPTTPPISLTGDGLAAPRHGHDGGVWDGRM